MVNLQKLILKKYNLVHNHPTLRFISEDTGIQITRVFRIINGHEMKLSEYERFQSSIDNSLQKCNQGNDLYNMAELCIDHLSHESIEEIKDVMDRKLRYKFIA